MTPLADVSGLLAHRGGDRARVRDRRVHPLPRLRGGRQAPRLARDVLGSCRGDGARGRRRRRHRRVGRHRRRVRAVPSRPRARGCVVHYHRGEERARAARRGARRSRRRAGRPDEGGRRRAALRRGTRRARLGSRSAPRSRASTRATTRRCGSSGSTGSSETIAENLTATFLTARAFLRGLGGSAPGALVLVGLHRRSLRRGRACGLRGREGGDPGRAAPLAEERGGAPGARVSASTPSRPAGRSRPMTRGLLTEEDDVRRITRTMPLRKVATPEDVAAQVVVLASDRLSGHVTRRARDDRRRHGGPRPPRPVGAGRRYSRSGRFLPMQEAPPGRELTAINSMAVEWRVGRRWPPLSVSRAPTGRVISARWGRADDPEAHRPRGARRWASLPIGGLPGREAEPGGGSASAERIATDARQWQASEWPVREPLPRPSPPRARRSSRTAAWAR